MLRWHSLLVKKTSPEFYRAVAVALCSFTLPCGAFANPVLDNVGAGVVTIQQGLNSTTINQTTQQAIINWQNFNIGANEVTRFQQPNGGVALNRINPTQGASQIYGTLTATGQIILVNPAGIYFGPGAYVNVGGLIATTNNITDQNFLNGLYRFDRVAGYNGAIINKGTLIAANNGLIALVGAGVQNDGTIQANLGKVVLASGDAFTMSFAGNDLINFTIDKKTSSAGQDSQGNKLNDGVKNTGSIIANGGKVLITAQAAAGVLDSVINLQGVVQARSVSQANGEIVISGDTDAGVLTIAGKIDASGKNSSEKGGNVDITGYNILLDSPTLIDVSGDIGGGMVNVGGGYQGAGSLAHANATVMAKGAQINANAITSGQGGKVVLWSDNVTRAYGSVSAEGGVASGNGGSVETSSYHYLDTSGFGINLLAANGQTGNWLLDPADITICANCTSTTGLAGSIFSPGTGNSLLLYTDLQTQLASANVILQTSGAITGAGSGDININTGLSWGSTNGLTLTAFHDINVTATLSSTGASTLKLIFNNNVGGTSNGGALNINGGSIQLNNANSALSINGQAYTLVRTQAAMQALTNGYYALPVNMNAGGWSSYTPSANFSGIFNGLGNTISNFTYTTASSPYAALIARSTGSITNIGLINPTITNISNVYDSPNGLNYAAALVADNLGNIANAYATGISIKSGASIYYTGGLVGYNESGSITNSYTTGVINSSSDLSGSYVGGLVGANARAGLISLSYANTNLSTSGHAAVGGFAGYNGGRITNAYAVGNVSSTTPLPGGGFIGRNGGSISNSYSMGAANANNIRGFFGDNYGSITNSFWNTETSGTTAGGYGSNGDASGLTGYTTAQIEAGLPSELSGAIWGNGNNLTTPYLLSNNMPNAVLVAGSNNTTYYSVIQNMSQLQAINSGLSGRYILGANINAAYYLFSPIGTSASPFTGIFNGIGNAISNLTINLPTTNNVGLFGAVSGATITNLDLVNANVTGRTFVGSLAGLVTGNTTINNIYTHANVTMTAGNNGGGMIGGAQAGVFSFNNLLSEGNVTANGSQAAFSAALGGLIGYLNSSSSITLSQLASTANVSVGSNSRGSRAIGGLIGAATSAGTNTLTNSYATGRVTTANASTGTGGLIGQVTGGKFNLVNAYAAGPISGTGAVGGLIGSNAGTLTVTNSYWDSEVTGVSLTAGGGTGLTTVQMMDQANFSGWDFNNIWNMTQGQSYPYLRSMHPSNQIASQ